MWSSSSRWPTSRQRLSSDDDDDEVLEAFWTCMKISKRISVSNRSIGDNNNDAIAVDHTHKS